MSKAISTVISQIATRKPRPNYSDRDEVAEYKRRHNLTIEELLAEIGSTIETGNPFDLVDRLYEALCDRFGDFFFHHETLRYESVVAFNIKHPNPDMKTRYYNQSDCKLLISVMSPAILSNYAKEFIDRAYRSRPVCLIIQSPDDYYPYAIHSFWNLLGRKFISLLAEEDKLFKPSRDYMYFDKHSKIIRPLLWLYSYDEHLPVVVWDMVLSYLQDAT